MKYSLELRNKPELKIILNREEFEVLDVSEPKNSGTYPFRQLKKVNLNAAKTNWLFSAFTMIVDFFVGSGVGGKFKSKANLELEMENRNLKIWLIEADFEKAKKATELLNEKKSFTLQHL